MSGRAAQGLALAQQAGTGTATKGAAEKALQKLKNLSEKAGEDRDDAVEVEHWVLPFISFR
jgi:enamine deaminase RidA (YjgF/YER057c/UK114 family)